jgi:Holliday junction resolvase RusA-like endonuclease
LNNLVAANHFRRHLSDRQPSSFRNISSQYIFIGDSDDEQEIEFLNPVPQDMSRVSTSVLGPPSTWQRPGHGWNTAGSFYAYNPNARRQQRFAAAVNNRLPPGWVPFTGPVEVLIDFVYADMNRRGRYGGPADIDNLLKFVFDSLNELLYNDDVQICRVVATKRYGRIARTNLTVRQLNDDEM